MKLTDATKKTILKIKINTSSTVAQQKSRQREEIYLPIFTQ